MKRRIFVGLGFAAAAGAQVAHQEHGKHMHADVYAKVLDDPSRDAWQKPHEVIMALALKADEVVADIGAGTGYFAKRFARHAGKVYAVDIEAKLLEIAKKSAPANMDTVLAAPDDPKLAARSVDTIFVCDVLHHIDGRPAYYAKLKEALKPGGRVAVIDFHKRPLPVGPPPEMKISREEMIGEFEKAGFVLAREHTMLPHQYFLEFRPR
ncbi:MAG: methyltransferase domain-containing protein [Bryobacteraceae bacterium]|nr:methyltransferase domain-containing protein [Bryobacteraceae bacterium]